MASRSTPSRFSAVIVTAVAVTTLSLASAAEAGMYRYTDNKGRMVISNTIPQEATKRGYEILGNNGRVVETIPPAPTDEEIAAREAEKERQKELAAQQEQDRKLLKRYSHPDQAVRAMHRKIRELKGLIQIKRGNISVISSQLDSEQSRAANIERSGGTIPEVMLEKIRRLESQIRDLEREISIQNQEIDELEADFETDIKRLEKVTGKSRTLTQDTSSER